MKNDLDILLVHANASKEVYQGLSREFSSYEQPLWAGMIATYLRNKGFNVDILDCEVNQLTIEESVEKVKSLNPKVICAVIYGQQPSASNQNMHGAAKLMTALKDLDKPRIYVGLAPSALPERIVNDNKDVFVCRGEGPKTLEPFLQIKDYHDTNELKNIPGLWYYDRKENKVVGNCSAPLIMNLDEEMPEVAWDLLPMMKYRTANWHSWTNNNQTMPFSSIYTSLGCPFACQFCCINAPFNEDGNTVNRFRHWSPERIIKTFDHLADMGIRNIKISDEMYILRVQHFMEVSKLLKKRGHNFNIWCYGRVAQTKKEYLIPLKESGVNWIGLGIESASKQIRQEVTKGQFEDILIKDLIKMSNDVGISITGNFIFGLPTDSVETMTQTLNEAMELEIDYFNGYSCMAYPGSFLHREAEKNNPEILPENNPGIGWLGYSQHAYETFPMPTNNLKNWEVLKFRDEAFTKFFTNPVYIDRMTKKFGSSFKDEMDRMLKIKLRRKIVEENDK